MCDNYYFCYYWQALLTNERVFLPGFMPRAAFLISSSGEFVLRISLAKFFSALPVSCSRLALINTDMRLSVEQRAELLTVSMARAHPVV